MLHPDKTLEEIAAYLIKIAKLLDMRATGDAQEEVRILDDSIKRFIRRAFFDGEVKRKEYEDAYHPGMTWDEDSGYVQQEYTRQLNAMRSQLLAFREDVEQDKPRLELLFKKEMADLEAESKGAVVEEKEVEPPIRQYRDVGADSIAAGVIFFLFTLIVGWNEIGKFLVGFGSVLIISGAGSFWKPEIFGPIAYQLIRILENVGRNYQEQSRTIEQKQDSSTQSPQVYSEGDTHIHYEESRKK